MQQGKRYREALGRGERSRQGCPRVIESASRADQESQFFIAEAEQGGAQGRNQSDRI